MHPSIHSCTHSHSFTFIHSSIHPSIHPSIHSFIHSFNHSFVRSFIHLSTHSEWVSIYKVHLYADFAAQKLQCPTEDYTYPPKPAAATNDQNTDDGQTHITSASYPAKLTRDPVCDDVERSREDAAFHYAVTTVYQSLGRYLPNEDKGTTERDAAFYNSSEVLSRLVYNITILTIAQIVK